MLPESHREFAALAAAKVGYWDGYQDFLTHQLQQTRYIAGLLEEELR